MWCINLAFRQFSANESPNFSQCANPDPDPDNEVAAGRVRGLDACPPIQFNARYGQPNRTNCHSSAADRTAQGCCYPGASNAPVRAADELKTIDSELEKIIGRPVAVRRRRAVAPGSPYPMGNSSSVSTGKRPDLQELKALLAAAPNKTISLRKEGYEVRNVKILAMANPHLLRMGGKGPWPEVTLLK